LAAATLIGCLPIRKGNDLGYDFAVYVDRAEGPGQTCAVDIGLHNNLDTDYANFEYALNLFDSQGRWSAGPLVQGDYVPSGGVAKRDFVLPIACDRVASAKVARELCLDIVGWTGHQDCYDIDLIVINETVPMAEAPAEPRPAVEPPPAGKPRLYTVFFDWDRADINPVAQRVIDAIVSDWAGLPESLQLVGHADRSGPDPYNQRLSERRVVSVTRALGGQGIASERVGGYGVGETQPLVPTPDGAREPRNRRVEVTVEGR
jgi:outer membrane protein OmpA-like peptidoglycan-associated protein